MKDNLWLIKKQLKEHPEWLSGLYIYKPHKIKDSHGTGREYEKMQHKSQGIGYWQIYRWIHNIDTTKVSLVNQVFIIHGI